MQPSALKLFLSGVGLLMASQSHAAPLFYSFKDLGTLGGLNSSAQSINNASQVTGFSELPAQGSAPAVRRAMIWSTTGVVDLGVGTGYSINAAGHVAGSSTDSSGNEFATLWIDRSPTLLGLGTAFGINDQDHVVGALLGADAVRRAAVWRNATATTLSDVAGQAHGINNAGQIVGWTSAGAPTDTSKNAAIRWVGDVAQNLGATSGAYAINESNVVVGEYSFNVRAPAVPAMWSASGQQRRIDQYSNPGKAYAINKAGLVVGYVSGEGTLWDTASGTPVYVASLKDVVTNLPGKVMQLIPLSINDKNEIVGSACYQTNGSSASCHAFLLTPTVAPTCEAKVELTSNVNLSFSATVALRNLTGSAATGWEVDVSLSNKTLLYAWQNAKVRTSGGSTVIGQPLSKNQTIAAQSAVTFTFSGLKYASVLQSITGMTATLGGQSCAIKFNML